jgi:hypothetical protein
MKPAPQISSPKDEAPPETNPSHRQPSAPLTDYNFKTTADTSAGAAVSLPEKNLRAFRTVGRDFLDREMNRDDVAEFFFFALITGISAWPIFSMIETVTRLVRKY